MNLGVVQGRLSRPIEGFQECPVKWQDEFDNLESAGLNHIEWIVTKKSFNDNPIFKYDLSKFPISSICADHVVDDQIANENFLIHSLEPVCNAARRSGIKRITIPLLEDSSVEDDDKRREFIKFFFNFAEENYDINFSLETELSLEKIPSLLARSNITLTYDIGNTTACGLDHQTYIQNFCDRISNVHLKDRKLGGKSVEPGTGDADFQTIFNLLINKGYDRDFTMQFCRGSDGNELAQCKKHADFVRSLYVNIEKI